ncbi:MAG: hypothetical protein MI755_09520 [Sphingomonadales bacterium]|nr:hypothetical protein [Sphingomonadales bacterium]
MRFESDINVPSRPLGNGSVERKIRRILLIVAGTLIFAAGFLTFWLPIPIGLILMAVGLALLLVSSAWVRSRVKALRHRYPGLDSKLKAIGGSLPGPFRRALQRTEIRGRRKRVLKTRQSEPATGSS